MNIRDRISQILIDLKMPNNTALFLAFEIFAKELEDEFLSKYCSKSLFNIDLPNQLLEKDWKMRNCRTKLEEWDIKE